MASGSADISGFGMDGDDTFGDDSKLDKKKKFKPFQKIRNFFGGSSKKRFKADEHGKAHSIGALNQKMAEGDDDDDGGFLSKSGLGSRSISEDSVFKPEVKESPKGILQGHAVSMENITNINTKPLSGPIQSDQSLRSMDGSSDLEMSRSTKRLTSSQGSLDGEVDIADFESVRVRSSSLTNEAAKHRISVKPKSRRVSTKVSMKRNQRPQGASYLPNVQEESPQKTHEEDQDVGTPGPVGSQKTVFATTIPVGSVLETPGNMSMDMPLMTQSMYVPRSQPSQAVNMQRSRATEDIERSRPRSMSPQSPFSTSPVSMSMLQEVKLRPRQAPEKTPAETVPQASGSENELAKAFNRAKRISKKFDESGALNMESQKSKVQETETVSSLKDLNQSSVKPVNVKLRSAEMTKSDEKASLPTTAVDKNIPVTEPSFAVKKDPLKPAFKSTTLPVNMKPSDMEAFGDSQKSGSEGYGKKSDEQKVSFATDKTAGNVSEVSKATSEAAANKLASPREDYRMKRQARSKTLPVSKDLMDNNVETITSGNRRSANFENIVTNSSGANENKSDTDYENIGNVKKDEPEYDNIASVRKEKESSVRRRQGDYENFALNKRSSWAPSTGVAATSTGQPEWISRVQKLEKPADDKSDPARPKEIKIGPIKSENKKDSPKSPETEKITFEKASAVSKPASQPSAAKLGGVSAISKQSSIEKPGVSGSKPAFNTPVNSSQPNKPAVSSIGKPPIGSASKPISTTTPKSTPTDTKPTVSTSSVRKSSVGSAKPFQVEKPAFSSVKPPVALASKPSSDKPTASSSSSSTATSKLSSPTKSVGRPDSGGSKSSTPLNVSPHRASLKSNLAKTENKNTVLQPINNENKNINNKSSMNSSVGKVGSSFGSGKTGSEPEKATAGITKRFGGSIKGKDMKIEIIDKDKPRAGTAEQKSTNAPLREKAKVTPEKCSNISASRPSKVLDMVKNFQSMQVT